MRYIKVVLHQKLPGKPKGRDITLGNEPIQATRGRNINTFVPGDCAFFQLF